MLRKYNNKFIYGCKFLQTRLNLNPKTFSLCHEAQVGDQILGTISELSVKQYEKALSKLIEENFDKNSPCRRCEKCQKEYRKKWDRERKKKNSRPSHSYALRFLCKIFVSVMRQAIDFWLFA